MTRIMITCAGSQKKWNGYLGVPSHLVKDRNGETILGRTVRQVRDRGYLPHQIFVFHPDIDGYFLPGVVSVIVPEGKYETEFHTTQEWWFRADDNRNVLLLGDTWFTDEAMDTILGYEGSGIRFFGHSQPNPVTGSPWGELLGYSWLGSDNDSLLQGMAELSLMKRRGELWRFCGWEILYWWQCQKVRKDRHFEHRVKAEYFTEIVDLTGDLDFAVDHQRHPMFGGNHG